MWIKTTSVILLGLVSLAPTHLSPPNLTAVEPPITVAASPQNLPVTATTRINNRVIELEVARTPDQQATGLMYRASLPPDRGMLFPFQPPRVVRFWMKNVFIDLDMVFLQNGVVKAIYANVPPCKKEPCPVYGPDVVVDSVIELAGGRSKQLGLKVGDRLSIEPR